MKIFKPNTKYGYDSPTNLYLRGVTGNFCGIEFSVPFNLSLRGVKIHTDENSFPIIDSWEEAIVLKDDGSPDWDCMKDYDKERVNEIDKYCSDKKVLFSIFSQMKKVRIIMKKVYKLNIHDVERLIAAHFQVPIEQVVVTSCGCDKDDGPFPGSGNFIHIEVEQEVEDFLYEKDKVSIAMEWNYNMKEAPLETPIRLLSDDDCFLLPQREYVGTIIDNGTYLTRGECIEGDPEYFHRSAIVAWKPLL